MFRRFDRTARSARSKKIRKATRRRSRALPGLGPMHLGLERLEERVVLSFVAGPGSPHAVGAQPREVVAVGDFNNDGLEDLATANNAAGNISVLLGMADGGFAPAISTPPGSIPGAFGIAAAHFNGDANMDLVVTQFGSAPGLATILFGNGTGAFPSSTVVPLGVGTASPLGVDVGDFNLDGNIDFATANNGSNNVSVMLGNGTGGFTAALGSPIATGAVGGMPQRLKVGNLGGPGLFPDIAVANGAGGSVSILRGTGGGAFAAPLVAPTGGNAVGVAIGDFNADGTNDLAVTNFSTSDVAVLNGAAAFAPFGPNLVLPAGATPSDIVAADFNADGDLDLATANFGSDNVSVFHGAAGGTFVPDPNSPYATPDPRGLAVGDFNDDTRADFAVTNDTPANTVSVFLNAIPAVAPAMQSQAVVWGVQPSTGRIVLFDPDNGDIYDSFPAPGNLAPTHTAIGLTMARIGNPSIPPGAPGSTWELLYINDDDAANDNTIFRLNPLTGAVLGTTTANDADAPAAPFDGLSYQDVGPAPTDEKIFLSHRAADIHRKNGFAGAETTDWETGARDRRLGRRRLWARVRLLTDGAIHEYSPTTDDNAFNSTLPAPPGGVQGLAFDSQKLYASTATGSVFSLDPDTGAILNTLPVFPGGPLFGLAAGLIPADALEPNDTQATATDLGTVVHAVLPDPGIPFPPGPLPDDEAFLTISPAGDEDWFKVTSWATGSFDFTLEAPLGAVRGEVVDASGNVISSGTSGPLFFDDFEGGAPLWTVNNNGPDTIRGPSTTACGISPPTAARTRGTAPTRASTTATSQRRSVPCRPARGPLCPPAMTTFGCGPAPRRAIRCSLTWTVPETPRSESSMTDSPASRLTTTTARGLIRRSGAPSSRLPATSSIKFRILGITTSSPAMSCISGSLTPRPPSARASRTTRSGPPIR
jgi:hypothetical protein